MGNTRQTQLDSPQDCKDTLAVIKEYEPFIQRAAERFKIAPADIRAIIGVESHGKPGAAASAKAGSAHGLMQVTGPTWADMQRAHTDLKQYDFGTYWNKPEINILFGAATLSAKRASLKRFGVDIDGPNFAALAVTAYNGGEGVVELAYKHAQEAGAADPAKTCLEEPYLSYGVDNSRDKIWSYYMPGHAGGKQNKGGTRAEAVHLKTREIMKYPHRVEAYLGEEQREGLTKDRPQPTQPDNTKETKPDTKAPTPSETADKTDDGGHVTVTVTELNPLLPGHIIADSVGAGGRNHASDVAVVQEALARHGVSPGAQDARIGKTTIAAIEKFQHGFLKHADGLVEVGKATEQHLMDGGAKTAPTSENTSKQTPEVTPEKTTTPNQTTTTQPTTETPTTTAATPENAGLAELMGKAHLKPEEIEQARRLIAAEPKASRFELYRALQAKVLYSNQRDNQAKDSSGRVIEAEDNHRGKMCNVTALAMCLEYLGVPNPHPTMQYEDALEKVRQEKSLPGRTERGGWGGIAKALGVKFDMLAEAGAKPRAWWQKVVGAALGDGKSVMVSLHGHIVRIQDVTPDGVVADDPYGHSKLLAGTGHKWLDKNSIEGPTANREVSHKGEDITWPWDQVEPHSFFWMAAFHR